MTHTNKSGRWIAGGVLAAGILGFGAVRIGVAQTSNGGGGGTTGTATGTATPAETPAAASQEPKVYVSQLFGLNGTSASGTARFVIDGDQFGAVVEASGLDAGITHLVRIHAGSTCPTQADDTNGDGYVDIQEGAAANGGILVPLGANLNSQGGGLGFGPTASVDGTILYAGSGQYPALIQDLRSGSADPSRGLVKLQPGEDLALETRTVEIHGISQALPDTVKTVGGLSANQTLPVACGTIVQVSGPVSTPTPGATSSESPAATPIAGETGTPEPTESPSASPTMSGM